MDEQYFLVNQGHFTWLDTEAMAVGERQFFCKKLVAQIKEHNKKMKEAEDAMKASQGRSR